MCFVDKTWQKQSKKLGDLRKIYKTYFTLDKLFCIIRGNNGENYLVVFVFSRENLHKIVDLTVLIE